MASFSAELDSVTAQDCACIPGLPEVHCVSDSCYCRILTSFWFLRGRLNCLTCFCLLQRRAKFYGLGWRGERANTWGSDTLPSWASQVGLIYTPDLKQNGNGGSSGITSSFRVSTSLILRPTPRAETGSVFVDEVLLKNEGGNQVHHLNSLD